MNIPIAIVDENGKFHKLVINTKMFGQFAEMLRKDGPTDIHTMDDNGNKKTYKAHGMVLVAKGCKGNFMYIPEEVE